MFNTEVYSKDIKKSIQLNRLKSTLSSMNKVKSIEIDDYDCSKLNNN